MLICESPNKWSCLPAAFSTCTGIPFSTLLEKIGHDGSEVVFPDLEEPDCRRGFVGQELTLALLDFGFVFGSFESQPIGYLDETHHYALQAAESLPAIMSDSIGVIGCVIKTTGKLHSVAWDGTQCYDPIGFIRPLDFYEVQIYYRLGKG